MTKLYEVYDNFLPLEDYQWMHSLFCTPFQDIAWTWGDKVLAENASADDLDNWQFVHNLYYTNVTKNDEGKRIVQGGPRSDLHNQLKDVYERLGVTQLLRAKANLLPKAQRIVEHGMHNDQTQLEGHEYTVAIYYLNTNNGYTKLEDGTKIKSVANRMLVMSGAVKHTGSTCTDEKCRVVINFNYT
tara:strand:+ start:110 stop:667 length:558 start_codon:yes stop_codon:yes gene_type:complete